MFAPLLFPAKEWRQRVEGYIRNGAFPIIIITIFSAKSKAINVTVPHARCSPACRVIVHPTLHGKSPDVLKSLALAIDEFFL